MAEYHGISYPKFLPTRILKKTFLKIMKNLPESEIIENNFQIDRIHIEIIININKI